MHRILLFVAALAVSPLILPPSAWAQRSVVRVTEPFVRAALRGHTAAAYMKLQGGPDKLIGVASDAAERVELHETAMENGVMTMRPVGGVLVSPGVATRLAPGGLHVMLIGLKHALKAGDRITLTLTFERAGKATVIVPVARAGTPSAPGRQMRH
jgi:copper(I)-binding protein